MKQFKASVKNFIDIFFIHVTIYVLTGAERKEGKRDVDNHINCLLGW